MVPETKGKKIDITWMRFRQYKLGNSKLQVNAVCGKEVHHAYISLKNIVLKVLQLNDQKVPSGNLDQGVCPW